MSKAETIMQKSYPALTHLGLEFGYNEPYVLPKGFLNGSSPCLQYLCLRRFLFPEVPTFLLSSHNLVTLKLEAMYQDCFISPEAMVECLSGMTKLKTLSISFDEDDMDLFAFDQERTRLAFTTRVILPSLTRFHFTGHCGFLEKFIAQIDAPLLLRLGITYHYDEDTDGVQASQLFRFVGHTENLKFDKFSRARVRFEDEVTLDCSRGKCPKASPGLLSITCPGLDTLLKCLDQVLDTAKFLGQFGTTRALSYVNHLSVNGNSTEGYVELLPFSRSFPAVEELRLSGIVGAVFASELEDITEEMVTEIFPALHTI